MIQARRKRGGRGMPPHFLADQLTLSQPGGHIIPSQYYVPPQIFRPCDGPGMHLSKERNEYYKKHVAFQSNIYEWKKGKGCLMASFMFACMQERKKNAPEKKAYP